MVLSCKKCGKVLNTFGLKYCKKCASEIYNIGFITTEDTGDGNTDS